MSKKSGRLFKMFVEIEVMYKTCENKLLVQNIVFWLCFASSSFLYISSSFISNGAKAYIIHEVALRFFCSSKTFANKKLKTEKDHLRSVNFKISFLVSSVSSKKRNEKKLTWGIIVVKSYMFVCFLEETSAWKNHFEFVWPL